MRQQICDKNAKLTAYACVCHFLFVILRRKECLTLIVALVAKKLFDDEAS